jgi:KaiC/GvpD/RAD55 family RecA-like ATPase
VSDAEPYSLDPLFEQVVLHLCSSSRSFWARVGYALDPKSLELPVAGIIVSACRQIARERGQGPGSTILVLQRLARQKHSGKVTSAELQQVNKLYGDVESMNGQLPPEDAVVEELVPVIKRRMQQSAILAAHAEFSRSGDFGTVRELLAKEESLGISEQIASGSLDVGFRRIEDAESADRLSTGIFELDMKINGGVPRGLFGFWIGDTGAGKSFALIHQAADAMIKGLFVGYVTLELPEHIQYARLYGNLVGLPYEDILSSKQVRVEAERRKDSIRDKLGRFEMGALGVGTTTVLDLVEWVDVKEQEHGEKMELLVVDYADKMHSPKAPEHDTYMAMGHVYEGLWKQIAEARKMWVWTASQGVRPTKDSQKLLDLRHVADSYRKGRNASIVVTLNRDEEDDTYSFFLAKCSWSRWSRKAIVGPLAHDLDRARLVPFSRELGAW